MDSDVSAASYRFHTQGSGSQRLILRGLLDPVR